MKDLAKYIRSIRVLAFIWWTDRLGQAQNQRDALSQQLEDLFRLRHTDVELSLQQQALQYEAQLKGTDTVSQIWW